MIDLTSIPPARLALLDTAILYPGSHPSSTSPDCKHCARELLHEVVTGKHEDSDIPGLTKFISILPSLNDGEWKDDAHRTEVIRPYLKKLLLLDPAKDEERTYLLLNKLYRQDFVFYIERKRGKGSALALQELLPIVDRNTLEQGNRILVKLNTDRNLNLNLNLYLNRNRNLNLNLNLNLYLDLYSDLYLDLYSDLYLDLDLDRNKPEKFTRETLDLICSI